MLNRFLFYLVICMFSRSSTKGRVHELLSGDVAVRLYKALVFGVFLAVLIPALLELLFNQGAPVQPLYYWLSVGAGLMSGAYLARYISWGWLLGAVAGGILGFSAPIYPIGLALPDLGYEKALGWLLISGSLGLIAGGHVCSRLFKKLAKR
ncbi:MAG: hypothetical protein ACOH2R_01170 [Pseudomonas sp.]